MPISREIQRAHDARDELRAAVGHLDAAYRALDTDAPGCEPEDQVDGPQPLDAISDARAACHLRIDAIGAWLSLVEPEGV